MSRFEIYELLGLPPRGLLITNVQVLTWGKCVVIECLYDPEIPRPFQLIFDDCQSLNWELLNPDGDEHDDMADVIGVSLGQSLQQKKAVIHTDIFELSISYGNLGINNSW